MRAAALVAVALAAFVYAASAQAHGIRPGVRSAAPSGAALSGALEQNTGLAPSQVTSRDICPAVGPGYARCAGQALVLRSSHALVRPHTRRHATLGRVRPAGFVQPATASALTAPSAGTPAYLQQAYDLSYLSQTRGAGDTIAVIDAFDDPTAESDLATYRSTFGLPACTTANSCFKKVNEFGHASPLPSHDSGWEQEESLDLDAVSALCPNCHILLVEAGSSFSADLAQAMQQASKMGANQISASWTVLSSNPISGTYTFPGIAVVAATGDTGYAGASKDIYPAAFAGVTAAGGTSLAAAGGGNARGFSEGAWSLSGGVGGGSGCDLNVRKPTYQTDTGCSQNVSGQTFGRSYADVSADADPNTGLNIYDTGQGGWEVIGGTSLATPLISGYYAITGVTTSTAQWAYNDSALLNDPTTGSTGSCATGIRYICNAGTGYDGPTGAGSISGAVATGAPGIGGPANGSGSSPTYTQSTRSHGATLEGGIYPNGLETKWWIEYGTDKSYGQQSPSTDIGAASSPVQATGYLSHLAPGTIYHYRLVAQNSVGTTYGYDYTFTTPQGSQTDPTAAFSAPTVAIPGSLAFNASSSGGSIADYSWDFGDGTGLTDNGPSATAHHPYANPGVYNVTLIVTDSNGLSDSTSQTVTVDAVPTASFAASPDRASLAVGFDAGGSTDTVGTITSYAWDFGDGATGSGATPTHIYRSRGHRTVTLTVTNDAKQTATATHTITVDTAPTPAFTAPAGAQKPGSSLSFDARASAAMAGGSITDYRWNFGDGSPVEDTNATATDTHAYAHPGVYTVSLTVTDDLGITSTTTTHTVTVDAAPTASFAAIPNPATTGPAVGFDARASSDTLGTITNYSWDFGDGAAGSGATTNHAYATPGHYTITLTVTNDAGQSSTSSQTVTVYAAPSATFSVAPATTQTGTPVSFNGSGSGDAGGTISAYSWDFGDGGTASGPSPSHAYSSPGFYTVTLTVTGSLGLASSTSHRVTVAPPPLSARLSAKRQKLATVLKHGLSVSVSTNTAAKAGFIVTLPVHTSRHRKRGSHTTNTRLLRTGTINFAPGTHTALLRLSRAAANKLRAGGNAVLTLQMTLTDVYGRKLVRSVKLKVSR